MASSTGKYYQFVSQDRLKAKVEQAILETQTQIMIPCTSKNKILSLLSLTLQARLRSMPSRAASAGLQMYNP